MKVFLTTCLALTLVSCGTAETTEVQNNREDYQSEQSFADLEFEGLQLSHHGKQRSPEMKQFRSAIRDCVRGNFSTPFDYSGDKTVIKEDYKVWKNAKAGPDSVLTPHQKALLDARTFCMEKIASDPTAHNLEGDAVTLAEKVALKASKRRTVIEACGTSCKLEDLRLKNINTTGFDKSSLAGKECLLSQREFGTFNAMGQCTYQPITQGSISNSIARAFANRDLLNTESKPVFQKQLPDQAEQITQSEQLAQTDQPAQAEKAVPADTQFQNPLQTAQEAEVKVKCYYHPQTGDLIQCVSKP